MLDLRIPITCNAIAGLKPYLWKELPTVKSGHRVEAVARGLGFGTYAAMRQSANISDQANGEVFSSYLREHGFDVEPVHLYRAVARAAIVLVLEKAPRLSIRGFGVGAPRWDHDTRRWSTPAEQYAEFLEERDDLLSRYGLDQFLLALAFVQRIAPTKTIRPSAGSYRLKHIAENMPCTSSDGTEFGPTYVANGALIAAALHAGFRMKTYVDHLGYDHINVSFNMPKRAIEDLDCEICPKGATAQRRAWLAERRRYRGFYGLRG